MDLNIIGKIFALGMFVVIAEILLKNSGKDDFAFWLRIISIAICMYWVIPLINNLFNVAKTTFQFY